MSDWGIQTIVATAITIALGAITFVLRRAVSTLDEHGTKHAEHERAFAQIREDLARNYVRHEQLQALLRDQQRMLNRLANLRVAIHVIAAKMGVTLPPPEDDGGEA
ncbi:MAG TPA: hypothetical protein VN181_03490 [Thermoanaerobaculia bacterium]|nr:hypothetical protein [Thermoanaerobaculia bacterium]